MSDSSKRRKRPGRIYLVYGALFFAFFLLLYFPAARAYVLLEEQIPAFPQYLRLSGVEGPWFAGSARKGYLGQVPVRQINWRFHPSLSGLFQAEVSFHSEENGHFQARIAPGPGSTISCTGVQAQLPLKIFEEIISRYNLETAGSASLAIDRLRLEEGYLQEAEGTVVLSRLRILKPQKLSLGDFKIELTTNSQEIKISINDNGGPLAVEGILLLPKSDGSYSFSGTFAARENGIRR